MAHCLLRKGLDTPQSRRACTICSFSFHRSMILTIGRLPYLGSGGFGQLGLAAPCSLISNPRSVMYKRIHFVSKISVCDSSVRYYFCNSRMLPRSVVFCPHSFKNSPLNLCRFSRFVVPVVHRAPLIWLPFLLSSCLHFLCSHRFFFFSFVSLMLSYQDCLHFRQFS
jgi:hypothetical protein